MDIELLKRLISIPSVSRDEKAVADMLEAYLWQLTHVNAVGNADVSPEADASAGVNANTDVDTCAASDGASKACGYLTPHRVGNNLWCESCGRDSGKPTIMLNAHIDTVKPASGWKRDPFTPTLAIVNCGGNDNNSDGTGSLTGTNGSGKAYGWSGATGSGKAKAARIYGLGANDDGGSVVALIEAYRILAAKEQPCRLVLTLSAEEEVSGRGGIEMLFPEIGNIDLAIVGEPTGMQMAVAEKGLMVLDCSASGVSGHAARNEGVNAIYNALPAIEWFKSTTMERVSPFLGPVKMSVTQIQAGTQHNVVPDACTFVVDVRSNELYTNQELLGEIERSVGLLYAGHQADQAYGAAAGKDTETEESTITGSCVESADNVPAGWISEECHARGAYQKHAIDIKARSTRLGSSKIDTAHPVVQRGLALGLKAFGSPTLSNQALLHCPSLKIGPGDSARSHTADEYIETGEIEQAVEIYVKLLNGLELQ